MTATILSPNITNPMPIIFLVPHHFTASIFCMASFGTRKCNNGPVAVCVRLCALPLIPIHHNTCRLVLAVLCACVCVRMYKHPPGEKTGHLGETTTTEMSHLSIKLPTLWCWGGGGREIWKAPIPLMRKASVWELGVLKEWKSDLRGKTKKEKLWKTECLCLRFLRQCEKPPSRDFIVISSVRWPVPGEAITLNRLTSDTDPASYRCLDACWRYSWLVPVWALFPVLWVWLLMQN